MSEKPPLPLQLLPVEVMLGKNVFADVSES